MMQRLGLALGTALLALVAGGVAQAQSAAKAPAAPAIKIGCPKAGTVVDRTEGDIAFTTTYRGADAADPAVCLSTTNGREQRILYGVYLQTDRTGRFEGRARLDQLFSGKLRETSFTVSLPTVQQGVSLYFERWARLDPQSVMVAGKVVNALVFQRTINGQVNNGFSARFTYFYDPVTAVWVKRNETVWRGDPEPMMVTKITLP